MRSNPFVDKARTLGESWPSIDDVPLHSGNADIREHFSHYACSQPECPPRLGVWYDWRCPRCLLHAEAALVNHDGDDITYLWVGDENCSWQEPSSVRASLEAGRRFLLERERVV